jgi:DNA repair protein RadD
MSAPTLHPYQGELIDRVYRAIDSEGQKRIIVVLPTGAGKTVIAAAIARAEVERGKRVLFASHRREITKQTVAKMHAVGLDGGIIQAGFPSRPDQPIQIASIQTLTARGLRPPAEVVFIDEAHHCRARTYEAILASYSDATVIGLTATPCRKDGRGLGNIFNALIEGPPVQELIDGKYLVPTSSTRPRRPISLVSVRRRAITTRPSSANVWTGRSWSATLLRTGTAIASAGRRWCSRPTLRIRSISVTNS